MADNLTTQSGTPATVPSASVIATDDVAGVHYQRVKLVDGTLDSNAAISGDATNGLDVDVTRVQGTVNVADGGGSLTVDGTVAVSSVGGTVAVSGPLTDTQLRASAVPVSGTFYQATQPVSATSLPLPSGAATSAKQPALGTAGTPSTDVISIQGVAAGTAVPVSGTFYQATQPVSIAATVAVDTELPSAAALADATSNPTTPVVGAGTLVYNGSTWDRLRGDTTAGAWVQVKNTTPIVVTSTPSTSTGFVRVHGSATGTSDTILLAAAGVGIKNYVTSLIIANSSTTSVVITIKDGLAGSTLLTTIAPALGGSNITLPIPFSTTANTALYFASSASVSTVYVTAVGYTGA